VDDLAFEEEQKSSKLRNSPDITSCSPRVTQILSNLPNVGLTPVTQTEQDRSPCLVQGIPHITIPFQCSPPGNHSLVEAVVIFEIVHSPFGICGSILRLKVQGSRTHGAGLGTSRGVDAEFETL
jgi:hypothetical protein